MKKAKILGVLGVVLMMLSAVLLVPTAASACTWTGCICVELQDDGTGGRICSGGITVDDPVKISEVVLKKNGQAVETYTPPTPITLQANTPYSGCIDIAHTPTADADVYSVVVTYQYWTGSCWSSVRTVTIDECAACPPVPEAPAIALMSLGLLAIGGYVLLRRRAASEIVEIG